MNAERLEVGGWVYERRPDGWYAGWHGAMWKGLTPTETALIDALLAARERIAALDVMMADALVALTASNLTETYVELSERYNDLWNKEAP